MNAFNLRIEFINLGDAETLALESYGYQRMKI